MRAHLQTMIWRAADQQGPPAVSFEITNFGWKVSDGIPHPITTLANIAPYELMQVVSCTCKVNNPCNCSRKNCSCAAAAVSCTNYCKCRADTQCENAHSNNDDDADNNDDAEIEDDSSESDDESDAQDLL